MNHSCIDQIKSSVADGYIISSSFSRNEELCQLLVQKNIPAVIYNPYSMTPGNCRCSAVTSVPATGSSGGICRRKTGTGREQCEAGKVPDRAAGRRQDFGNGIPESGARERDQDPGLGQLTGSRSGQPLGAIPRLSPES